ncbi:MAG: prolipoprotein diacylglyceryl transferase family protein [Candidatus Omnitrophota bacterium]
MHPLLFRGTPYETPSWDVFVLGGFFVVLAALLILRPKDFSVTRRGIAAFIFITLFTASLGAKLLYVYLHRKTLFGVMHLSFSDAFVSSGYAFLGALIAEFITMAVFTKFRLKAVGFLVFADFIMPFLLLHQAVTRIGCFMNGCCYGPVTDLPWGCVFMDETVRRHPTQIYFAIALVMIFFYARHLYKKKAPKGAVFFTTLFTYGLSRCILESWRVDSPHILGPVTLAQVTTFTLAVVSGICLYITLVKGRHLSA